MDFISHGLWGSITFGRKSRWGFGLAFAIGMAPDLFSFGVLYIAAAFGFSPKPDFSHGTPPESTIPQYVHQLYNFTHSFVVFLIVLVFLWLFLKRPVWELGAWGLHILADVPLHTYAFFPTPVLWPFSNWKFDGWQWMTPGVLIPNFVLLLLLYAWYIRHLYVANKKEQTLQKAISNHPPTENK